MDETDFHIFTTNLLNTSRTRVLKCANLFAVFDEVGDVMSWAGGAHGLYLEDMRHLSKLELRIWGQKPILLSSTVEEENALLSVDLTNPEVREPNRRVISDTIHVLRNKFLTADTCHEKIRLHNYGDKPISVPLSIHFGADFADMFEIRGTERKERGDITDARADQVSAQFCYEGLDGVRRATRVGFVQRPMRFERGEAYFEFDIPPRQRRELTYAVQSKSADEGDEITFVSAPGYRQAKANMTRKLRELRSDATTYQSSNAFFDHLVRRAGADMQMLITDTDCGPYPYAGTPWFNTVFGRDGLIAAYQMLNVRPDISRGVLSFLAATQAEDFDDEGDAEPGKILHEIRHDEMSNTGEVPFGRYYGSIDSTPLFVALAGAYLRRTADTSFLQTLWPTIKAAIAWIDDHGDRDDDGYVEYGRHTQKGLKHQGWKDSEDSVYHADGRPAPAPIALCEVQSYVYSARKAAVRIASALGKEDFARRQRSEAEALAERFRRDFWSDDIDMFVLALDGDKEPCQVRSSNAAQCLLSGIASREQATKIAHQVAGDAFFNGWGVRTIAAGEARYNPISYHNGSVWPHDNALIAAGLSRYGFKDEVTRILTGLYDASRFFDLNRLPELFCGFERRRHQGPTRYPVACAPQAWAAGGVFTLLESVLGMYVDARKQRVVFHTPRLPVFLDQVRLCGLRVGRARLDLEMNRYKRDVGVQILDRRGDVEVTVVK
ncbi:MAG: glycogen debranching N-terminal domain-containing protein [Persicimonas sp.]